MKYSGTTKTHPDLFVAGIVFSAEEKASIESLIAHLPVMDDDLNLAFVILPPASATQAVFLENQLVAPPEFVLIKAEDGQQIKTGYIYIVPDGFAATVHEGCLHLQKSANDISGQVNFLKSLATDQGKNSIAVLLTGMGDKGAQAITAIKEAGGMMAIAAIGENQTFTIEEREKADIVGCPIEIATQIESYLHNLRLLSIQKNTNSSLNNILQILSSGLGTDFSAYKTSTIRRRVDKRLGILKLKNTDQYYEYIKEHPGELNELYETMLIGVTEFFRDKDVFEMLKKYLSKIIENKKPGGTIRMWSVGCATGEEPFSLAVMLCELLGDRISDYTIQIFATDIDTRALTLARKGLFRKEQVQNLSEDLLNKYFIKIPEGYELKKSVRQYVLFSRHDITTDPPLGKQDLISCRNLLIYFNTELQREVLPVLHYALNAEGYLLLGKSENASELPDLFEPLERQEKLYQKLSGSQINALRYSHFKSGIKKKEPQPFSLVPELSLEQIASETLVKKFEHPYVVVGEDMDIHLIKGSLQPYLDISGETLSSNILKILSRDIHPALRTCFSKAKKHNQPCHSSLIRFKNVQTEHYLKLHIKPLIYTKNEKQYYLVIFEKVEASDRLNLPEDVLHGSESSHLARILELEQELMVTREHLQAFTEELENGNEELQAINEELQSANEELKSANEELETTNEELQSANEELHTANNELEASNRALVQKENELLKAKQEVEQTREKFEMALSNSKIFIGYQNKDLKYFWYHNSSARFKNADIIGKTDNELLGDEGREITRIKTEALLSGKDFKGEVYFNNRYWDISTKPIVENDQVTGLKTVAVDITELSKATSENERKQNILKGIIEESADRLVVIDTNFNIIALNKAQKEDVEQRFFKPICEGDNILEYFKDYPDVKQRLVEMFTRTLKGEKMMIERYESTQRTRNGSPKFYNVQQYPLFGDEGNIIGAVMTSRDITDYVQAEDQIHFVIRHTANLSDEQFFNDLTAQMYRLFEARHIFFAIYNKNSGSVESKAYRLEGKLVENITYDLQGTPCQAVLESQDFQSFTNVGGQFPTDEKLQKWKAEHYIGVPITSPTTGEMLGIFVMIHQQALPKIPRSDYLFNVIALRSGAELEAIQNLTTIKARDKQLLNITENLPEMIFEYISTDQIENDRFTFISPAVENIYEVSSQELYDNPHLAWDSIYEDDFESFILSMEHCSETLEMLNWTGRIVGRDTYKIRWVKITARPERIKNNHFKWHGSVADISRLKHIENELQHAKKRAEESAAAKEDFLATMSHEIRTPLNGIVGITDIMLSEAAPEQMEYLNLLKFSAENLMTLINNILDFSKLNAGKIDVSEANIHLKILLKNLKHAHSYRARENSNQLNFIVDKEIPDMVRGDDMIILQVLNNLIGNAVKFTRNGKVELILSLLEDSTDSVTIRFEVRDTGIGIAEEDLNLIFDKFQQVGDKTQNMGGTGLGLAISKKLVEVMDANLQVESTLGEGTSFYFTLILKKAFPDNKKTDPNSNELSLPSLEKSVRILLVEDVEENKEMLLRYFRKTIQLEADAASNGKEALEMLLENDYDIVLMDLRMPVMDGREATRIIRSWEGEKYRKLPIVALTADVFDINKEPNFTDVITKPFSPRELRSKIMEYAVDIDVEK